ncbi:ABC transporter ATP-binding protein/permease [Yinghuangia sp. ASG 101]|nr:ABC transporter ATP-binding protein/permease [Yinghuangia sp. ASG 101]
MLHDVTLALTPGTRTALVGRSGSGKSTLAALLPRFHDPDTGTVTVGGTDLRDITPEVLYRTVGFVLQEPRLLRMSVADNIRLARPDAPLADVHRAARAARIDDRIRELPTGYDAIVGEDVEFSGGETQRLSIARALLADTPLLVLDEATAFADPEAEADIHAALAELTAGRTVLTIAHRLENVRDADQIVVLDTGRVVERGRHDTLVGADGPYAALWNARGTRRRDTPATTHPKEPA